MDHREDVRLHGDANTTACTQGACVRYNRRDQSFYIVLAIRLIVIEYNRERRFPGGIVVEGDFNLCHDK
jgi:hypothetical protein